MYFFYILYMPSLENDNMCVMYKVQIWSEILKFGKIWKKLLKYNIKPHDYIIF